MEDQHGWKPEEYRVQIVYHSFMDHENKMFLVSLEVRDYDKRYCVMANLSEEMFLDLISKWEDAKDAGYVYHNQGVITKKGENMQ